MDDYLCQILLITFDFLEELWDTIGVSGFWRHGYIAYWVKLLSLFAEVISEWFLNVFIWFCRRLTASSSGSLLPRSWRLSRRTVAAGSRFWKQSDWRRASNSAGRGCWVPSRRTTRVLVGGWSRRARRKPPPSRRAVCLDGGRRTTTDAERDRWTTAMSWWRRRAVSMLR